LQGGELRGFIWPEFRVYVAQMMQKSEHGTAHKFLAFAGPPMFRFESILTHPAQGWIGM